MVELLCSWCEASEKARRIVETKNVLVNLFPKDRLLFGRCKKTAVIPLRKATASQADRRSLIHIRRLQSATGRIRRGELDSGSFAD
jgi:hypothetical protein